MTSNDPRVAILVRNLEFAVERYQGLLAEAETQLLEAQTERDRCAENLEQAKKLLKFEQERTGLQMRFPPSRYAGMSVREAALAILRQAGKELSREEITQALLSSGYEFESRYPGRALHAALIGVDMVVKQPDGKLMLVEVEHNGRQAG